MDLIMKYNTLLTLYSDIHQLTSYVLLSLLSQCSLLLFSLLNIMKRGQESFLISSV